MNTVTLKDPIERGLKVAQDDKNSCCYGYPGYTQRPDRKGTERIFCFSSGSGGSREVTLKDPIERGLKDEKAWDEMRPSEPELHSKTR